MSMSRHDNRNTPKAAVQQLNRLAGEVNAFLIILALGLAIVDGTCFGAMKLIGILPLQGVQALSHTSPSALACALVR